MTSTQDCESTNSKFRCAVVFACDINYLPYTIFAIERMREVEPDATYDICIASTTLDGTEFPFEKKNIRFLKLDTKRIEKLRLHNHVTQDSYTRILLPELLQPDYDRILYLDSDTYLNEPGLQYLLDIDMQDHVIAAAPDQLQWRQSFTKKLAPYLSGLGVQKSDYFNAGVMLVDTYKFKKRGLEKTILDYSRKNPDKVLIADQSATNAAMKGEWLHLPLRWNWQIDNFEPFNYMRPNIKIVHFNNTKPWNSKIPPWQIPYAKLLFAFMNERFPEYNFKMPEALPAHNKIGKKLEILWRRQRYVRRLNKIEKLALSI